MYRKAYEVRAAAQHRMILAGTLFCRMPTRTCGVRVRLWRLTNAGKHACNRRSRVLAASLQRRVMEVTLEVVAADDVKRLSYQPSCAGATHVRAEPNEEGSKVNDGQVASSAFKQSKREHNGWSLILRLLGLTVLPPHKEDAEKDASGQAGSNILHHQRPKVHLVLTGCLPSLS